MLKNIRLLFFFVLFAQFASAQEPAFYKDIQRFKKQDSLSFPAKNSILFVGSSSFTNWKDVQSYFPGYPIINRGFGGSSLPDVIRYTNDIILPYEPKQVIIYCGENDLTAAGGIDAATIAGRVMRLIALIRCRYPNIPVGFISLKPSPSRLKYAETMRAANKMIEQLVKENKYAEYINVHDAMLNADGSIKAELFLSDQLHMNAQGYAIWQKIIAPYLVK